MLTSHNHVSQQGKTRSLRRSIARWSLIGTGILVVLVLLAVVVLRVGFHGERLARLVENQANSRIRGRIEVGSIDWSLSDLPKVATGGWMKLTLRDVKVYEDEEKKTLLLRVPRATAEVDVHGVMFGRHDITLRRVTIPDGGWVLIREVSEPYPMHRFDTKVVSLVSAFYPADLKTSYFAGISARTSPIFDLRDFTVANLDMDLEFGEEGAFKAQLRNINGKGYLYSNGSDPLAIKLYYSLEPTAESATIVTGGQTLGLRDIEIAELHQLPANWPRDSMPRDIEWQASAITTNGAHVSVTGGLLDQWGSYFGGKYAITVNVDKAGRLASKLSDGLASGEDLSIKLDITGPMLRPRYEVVLSDLDLTVPVREDKPPLQLSLARFRATFDDATSEGEIENTVARGLGGEMQISATFGVDPLLFDLYVNIPKPFRIGTYLPPRLRRITGSRLAGRLHAFGSGDVQRIDKLDVRLGRAHLQGELVREGGASIQAKRLKVTLGKTVVTSRGWLDYATKRFDMRIGFASEDLTRWLATFQVPPVASAIRRGTAHVHGAFDDPIASASFSAHGVTVVQRVDASVAYRAGLVTLTRASSDALTGTLLATGQVRLGEIPQILAFDTRAHHLDLSKIPVVGRMLKGLVNAHVTAKGPTNRPHARLAACTDRFEFAGDSYSWLRANVHAKPSGDTSLDLVVRRSLAGAPPSAPCATPRAAAPAIAPPDVPHAGSLELHARIDRKRRLAGTAALAGLPIESIALLGGPDHSPAGGTFATSTLTLGGTTKAPTVDGDFYVTQAWYGTALLGNARIGLKPIGRAKLAIKGDLFDGQLTISGTLGTEPPYDADITLDVRRVELDRLAPAVAKEYNARGWVSGSFHLKTALMGTAPPQVTAHLTELELVVSSTDSRGRPAPLRLRNKTPLHITFDGTRATLSPAILRGPAGDFHVGGWATADKLAMKLDGKLSADLLAPYLHDYFDAVYGTIQLSATITGKPSDPQLVATIEFDPQNDLQKRAVSVQPTGQDGLVTIPSGLIRVTNKNISVTGLRIQVVDSMSKKEKAALSVSGNVELENRKPKRWSMSVEGELAGKMLLVAAPTAFSAADGSALLYVGLSGKNAMPDINGTLTFKHPGVCSDKSVCLDDSECSGGENDGVCRSAAQPLSVTPRGLRRSITLTDGSVSFTDSEVSFDSIATLFDDEGKIVLRDGIVRIKNKQLDKLDVTLDATSVPFRIAKQIDLSISAENIRISGDARTLDIGGGGVVEIVDGRYTRKFNMIKDGIQPARTEISSKPFYEGVPLLANAKLDLQLQTRAFRVKNNIANIQLNGAVNVTGTLATPKFNGNIRVEEGSFKIPGIRARFTRTSGSIAFSKLKRFPEDTPVLNINSESNYRDSSGQEHLITLFLRGPLSSLNWDLNTSSGLNKAQTITLLLSGRTPQEVRQSLGDQGVGSDPNRLNSNADATSNFYDQVVKDVAGDFISLLLEDKLRNLTDLDVARIEFSTGSIAFHGEKNLLKNLRFLIDLERTLTGQRLGGSLQFKITDILSLEGSVLSRSYDDVLLTDYAAGQARFVWRTTLGL